MKKLKKVVSVLVCLLFLLTLSTTLMQVSAASNPYPSSQTIGGVTTVPCTRYAWQQTYDRLGIALPNWGNAINWLDRAANAGYATGSTAQANAIAVWKSSAHSYGHVSFVVSVTGNYMYVNEGGMNDSNGNAANGTGIVTNSKVSSIVGTKKSSYSSCTLLGFIYFKSTPSATVSITSLSDKCGTTNDNATLYYNINKPSDWKVTEIGIKIRKDGLSYADGFVYKQTSNYNHVGKSNVEVSWDFKNELNHPLTHATKYYLKYYAKVNGNEYWSAEYYFSTTGSHSYGSWTTTKSATCTSNGKKQRKCSCGQVQTETISALGHNYSTNWTTDVPATCSQTGSKSKHCSRCSSKTNVTTIAKTAHKYGAWEIIITPKCMTAGEKQRKCSCGNTQKETIAALEHEYSSSWTVDKKATCVTNGEKSQHCSRCNAKTNATVIKALGHSWNEWETVQEPTTTKKGISERKCENCSEKEQHSIAKLSEDSHKHNFGKWFVVNEPTCSADGKEDRKCTICGETEERTVVATGHQYDDFIIVTPATETAVGKRTKSCTVCGDIVEEEIPKFSQEIPEDTNSESTTDANTDTTTDDIEEESNNLWIWFVTIVILLGGTVAMVFIIRRKKANIVE